MVLPLGVPPADRFKEALRDLKYIGVGLKEQCTLNTEWIEIQLASRSTASGSCRSIGPDSGRDIMREATKEGPGAI
jgi:hypothetical protein